MPRRAAVAVLGIILMGVFCWFFPLFRIVPLEEARANRLQVVFDAASFAKTFWSERLVASLDKAADAATVVEAIAENPRKAGEEFGRSVGLSRARYFFLRGSGTVVSVNARGVGVSFQGKASEPDILLLTGLLFGNAIRDATGLLDASDFPDSQHFNELSRELNGIVEAEVIPLLKAQAEAGRRVEFVGCAEILDEDRMVKPLQVIPVKIAAE